MTGVWWFKHLVTILANEIHLFYKFILTNIVLMTLKGLATVKSNAGI